MIVGDIILLFLIFLFPTRCIKIVLNDEYSKINEDTFRVGVVSLINETKEEVFVEYIDEAGKHGIDYLILPEESLITLPQKIEVGTNPCDDEKGGEYYHSIHLSSCAARKNQIYVSYTTYEFGEPCIEFVDDRCWYDFHYLYNTAVVIDRDGTVIQKYRKRALFPPTGYLFKPGSGDPTFFKADFGVTIGIFICFEVFTHTPAWELVEKYGIQHIAYPTNFNDFPPITSLGVQQAYSETYGVSFFASNNLMNKEGTTASGSGIYVAGNPVVWTGEREDILLIADIPKTISSTENKKKKEKKKDTKNNSLLKESGGDVQKVDYINVENGTVFSTELSIPLIDCKVSFTVDKKLSDKDEYFVAYVGSAKFGFHFIEEIHTNLTTYVCGLIGCGSSVEECAKGIESLDVENVESSTSFSDVRIEVQYNFEVDSIFPLRNTNEKKLFDWGSFDFQQDLENNHAVIQSIPSIMKDQELLFVSLGYFDMGY